MKMMQEKQNCFDNCECNFDDCCEPRKCCHEECCEPKKYYYEEHCEPRKCYVEKYCEPRKCYCEECCEPKKCYIEKNKKCDCSPEPGKALLKCGSGAAGPFPIIAATSLLASTPIPVGSVTLDTRKLCNPTVLLNVNAIISAPVAITTSITFSVFKCCNGCTQPVGGSFVFSGVLTLLSNQSFNFQICDTEDCCCDCVTYSVQITSITTVAAGLTLSTRISALAVENNC